MNRVSRLISVSALTLMILSTACGAMPGGSRTPVGTILPANQTLVPATIAAVSSTPSDMTVTPLIPLTGENVVSMQCQFCVGTETHAVLVFPDFAYFDVDSSTAATCLTADVVDGQRILICRGPENTSFNLSICSDSSNCLQFPVSLQPCPLLEAAGTPRVTFTPFAPFFLTPIHTLMAPTSDSTQPASTAVPSATGTQGEIPTTTSMPANTPTPSLPTLEPTLILTLEPEPLPTQTPPPPVDPETPTPSSALTDTGGEAPSELAICHISPGNPDQRKTMTVDQSAWEEEHSRHGDTLGLC